MTEPAAPVFLPPDAAAQLAEFARACKSAARAVSLYPGGHPAIVSSLSRLSQVTARLTTSGPYRLQVHAAKLLVDGAESARPDSAIAELAELLHRHLVGALILNAGADVDTWRTLLLLLARTPDDVRGDGGIKKLWEAAGGRSLEIQEIDYAEVLREKQGLETKIEEIIAAALAGPRLELDDHAMETLLEIIQDPEKLDLLMQQLDKATSGPGVDVRTGAFLSLLRGLTEYASKNAPERLDSIYSQMGRAAGRLSAEQMLHLLAQRHQPDAMAGSINVVTAVVDHMSDESLAGFVAGSVIAERGASERLAHAFQSLVADTDRRRQLLSIAQAEVSKSELGEDPESFPQLWERVESMLTSYQDDKFVSDQYARELSSARTQAVDVEKTSDDPPERLATWLASVTDTNLRTLDHQLLLDLLRIEEDPLRWRDIADTAVTHADDLIRIGTFDAAWQLAEAVVDEGAKAPERGPHATSALERFGRGAMMKHVATHLRSAQDESFGRFKRICHAIGTAVIPALAEVLTAEQDARSRRRLRDLLVGFGAPGRESVQQLMNASNWEVRRTAAFLLREFGGSEGLKELIPLLSDSEPLVQREAVQALVYSGTDEAARILLDAISSAGRAREGLLKELMSVRDPRAAPLFSYLVRHVDRRRLQPIYISALEALAACGGPEAVAALKDALYDGSWWAPLATRQIRTSAAHALRKLGTADALAVLNDAVANGPRGVRAVAKAELARLG